MEVSDQLLVPAALPPVPNGKETEWAPEPTKTLWKRVTPLPLAGNRARFIGHPARSYTD
jgi:hypothetical protein